MKIKTSEVIDHIVKELTDYCDNAGLSGFVVGVSGGIDSAVSSSLCAKTGKKTILLNMPIYQAEDQFFRSERHIAKLEKEYDNVMGYEVDLTQAFKALSTSAFPQDIQDDLTMANTRSRLRMLALYAFAGHNKMLVVGTGNKVEDFGVGFFTKYGDGAVDISPIADLMKSEVYALGKALGVAKEIIEAVPTDGLFEDNRSDESQIGATYPELEWAMNFCHCFKDEEKLTEREKKVLSIYRKYHNANKHKIEPIPVIKISKNIIGKQTKNTIL